MSRVRETFAELTAGIHLHWWHEFFEFEPHPTIVQYDIRGEDPGVWHAVIGTGDPSCSVREGPAETVDLRLTLSDQDWLDLVAGRSSVWPLLGSGKIRADGNHRLITALTTMGLLGLPVSDADVARFSHPHFVSSAPYFVLPRALTAGALDHAKWRYFVEQGDLIATAVSPGAWPSLEGAAEARHIENLKRALKPVWWRLRLSDTLRIGLTCVFLALVLIVAWLAPWWIALLASVPLLGALVFGLGIIGPDDGPRRYAAVFTRLAYDDPEFFRFALERGLMRMSPSWGLDK
jgi:hypothetical protein